MPEEFRTREEVAELLGVSVRLLRRYERLGLVQVTQIERGTVYSREQIRRAWSVVSLHRDLGINPAGVAVILQMSEQIRALQAQLYELLRWLREHEAAIQRALEEESTNR